MTDVLFSGRSAEILASVAAVLQEEDDFVLICHVAPDGDAFGSTLGLLTALQQRGKKAYAVCDGVAGYNVAKVLPVDKVAMYDLDLPRAAVAIALDCADSQRMGRAGELFEAARLRIVIDHHVSNSGFGDINLICSQAAATAEMMVPLLDAIGTSLDEDIASYLYVGLITDTGAFAYSNTTPHTLRTAARLLASGFDFTRIYGQLYRARSVTKSRMLGNILSDFCLDYEGQYAHAQLDYQQLSELNALSADSEGLVDNLRNIDGVEVAVYVRENAKDVYKASMRSRDYVNVAEICAKQGGGGHERAAGFTWHGKIGELWDWLREEVGQALRGRN